MINQYFHHRAQAALLATPVSTRASMPIAMRAPLRSLTLAIALVLSIPVLAGPGHDHGDEKSAPVSNAAPRFDAHSDLFELVGTVQPGKLTLYLDRYADNKPVTTGSIELEIKPAQGAALTLKAAPAEEGAFTATLAKPLAPGAYAITATVSATQDGKAETDLLAATLEIPSTHVPESSPHQHSSEYVALGGALAAILGGFAWWKMRRRRSAMPLFGGVR